MDFDGDYIFFLHTHTYAHIRGTTAPAFAYRSVVRIRTTTSTRAAAVATHRAGIILRWAGLGWTVGQNSRVRVRVCALSSPSRRGRV